MYNSFRIMINFKVFIYLFHVISNTNIGAFTSLDIYYYHYIFAKTVYYS